ESPRQREGPFPFEKLSCLRLAGRQDGQVAVERNVVDLEELEQSVVLPAGPAPRRRWAEAEAGEQLAAVRIEQAVRRERDGPGGAHLRANRRFAGPQPEQPMNDRPRNGAEAANHGVTLRFRSLERGQLRTLGSLSGAADGWQGRRAR